MGRITIFTSASCGHCRRTKATLESRGLEYSEVSLSAHPERREDMTALASRVTVPQIFLNETHFGGNDDLERRLREDPDGFDEEVRRALAMPDPKDARLRAYDAFGEASDDDDDDLSFLSPPRDAVDRRAKDGAIDGETESPCDHFEATRMLREALLNHSAIRDVAIGARVHARCFDGAAFRDATRAAFFPAEKKENQGEKIARSVDARCASLLAAGTVVRVATTANETETETFDTFSDKGVRGVSKFRLRADSNPGCVSDARRDWPLDPSDAADPNATLARCMRILSRLETRHLETTAGTDDSSQRLNALHVNRASLAKHETFLRVVDRLSFLKRVRLETLKSERSDAFLAAFLINAYNATVRVSMTTVGTPRDAIARMTYFKRVGVRFADGFYSLDDIEHGLLRGNVETSRRFRFGGTTQQIPIGDPRGINVVRWDASSFSHLDEKKEKVTCTTCLDPRVHFALNCGARSCPPVSFYCGETLETELHLAAVGFCEDDENVKIVAAKGTPTGQTTVRVSKLFLWYRGDFGTSDREVLERIKSWCQDGSAKKEALRKALADHKKSLRIEYAPYDWSIDATPDSPSYKSANARESWGRFTPWSFWS